MKKILIFLMLYSLLLGNKVRLEEREGKFYKENKLFTGVVVDESRKKSASIFEYSDTVYTYEDGVLVNRKKIVYEERMIGYTNEFLVDQVSAIYNWDYENNLIYYKNYLDGLLIREGTYDFTYKKVGIWKEYIEGKLLHSTFDYDMYNEYVKNRPEGDFTIDKKEWDKFDKEFEYESYSRFFDENGEEFELEAEFDFGTFNGMMKIYLEDQIINEYKYQNGFVVENKSYYLNGNLKNEIILEEKGMGPFKKWKGYQRDYFADGKLKEEVSVTYKMVMRTPLDNLSDSFNPSNMKSGNIGIVESVSYSGPFRQFYSNGKLAVEGEDYQTSQDIKSLKVYDREGKRIFY